MDNDFEQFAQAVQKNSSATSSTRAEHKLERVCVLGGGVDGRVLAALCLAENASVTLFSAYGAELSDLRKRGGITLRGEGPIGTFQVDQDSVPSIQVTAQLDEAVADADLIILTGPVHKQRTYAMVLADHLNDGQIILIAPGRSFAAIEARWLLTVGGCQADVTVLEMSCLPYWSHSRDGFYELKQCLKTSVSSLPSGRGELLMAVARLFPTVQTAQSTLSSSFLDASGIIESVALLLGGSLVGNSAQAIPMGAVPLEENATFFSLLGSESSRNLVRDLLVERRRVATKFGVRGLPEDEEWVVASAGTRKGEGSRSIPDEDHAKALLRCAVTGSLVPLQSAGALVEVATPVTDSIINLASAALGHDLASAGRKLCAMGVKPTGPDDVRKQVEALVGGRS